MPEFAKALPLRRVLFGDEEYEDLRVWLEKHPEKQDSPHIPHVVIFLNEVGTVDKIVNRLKP